MSARRTAIAIALLAVLATGCDTLGPLSKDTVTITYTQVGACNGYIQSEAAPNSNSPILPQAAQSAGIGQAYVVFWVQSIDNKNSAIDFNFDPSKLFVNLQGQPAIDTNLSFYQDIRPYAATARTVQKGQFSRVEGNVIAVVPVAKDATEANGIAYSLLYHTSPSDPGVLVVKSNASQTSWRNTTDCRTLNFLPA